MTPSEKFLEEVRAMPGVTVQQGARLLRMVERLRTSLLDLCESIPENSCPAAVCENCHVRKALDYDGR